MAEIHDFRECLNRSHRYAAAPWWEEVYRKGFPAFGAMLDVRADGWAQRGGIDRVILLKSGKTLTVDEKVREQAYDDILLERWSDEVKQVPGWVQKDLACDFIAYAFAPNRLCYLLPFQTLRSAWIKHGPDWCARYPTVRARNATYVTASIPVPIKELLAAMTDVMTVSWTDKAA